MGNNPIDDSFKRLLDMSGNTYNFHQSEQLDKTPDIVYLLFEQMNMLQQINTTAIENLSETMSELIIRIGDTPDQTISKLDDCSRALIETNHNISTIIKNVDHSRFVDEKIDKISYAIDDLKGIKLENVLSDIHNTSKDVKTSIDKFTEIHTALNDSVQRLMWVFGIVMTTFTLIMGVVQFYDIMIKRKPQQHQEKKMGEKTSNVDYTDIIDNIQKIPPFPKVATRVVELIENDADNTEISKVVQYDQGITASCLKLCNSAAFNLQRRITTIDEAIVYIGLDNLIKIVQSFCAYQVLGTSDASIYLWKHSVYTAIASTVFYNYFNNKVPQKVNNLRVTSLFTCGLLHDIGKLVINEFFPSECQRTLLKYHDASIEFEKAFLGMDHVRLGCIIGDKWGFSHLIKSAIRYHHSFNKNELYCLSNIIMLSNLFVLTYDQPKTFLITSVHPKLLSAYNISRNDYSKLTEDFQIELQKTKHLLHLT